MRSIEHIGLYSCQHKALSEWYCDVLGFKLAFEKNGCYFVTLPDGGMLEICPVDPAKVKNGEPATGFLHLAITVDNFEEALAHLKKKQVKCREPELFGTTQVCFFEDIDGNLLHLIQRNGS